MFPFNTYPPYHVRLFDGRDVERLVDGILTKFDERELRRVLYYNFDLDWDNKVAPGPFEDRVFALTVALQSAGQLHWLIRLLDQRRPEHEVFLALRQKATPPLPASETPMPGPAPVTPDPPPAPGRPASVSTGVAIPGGWCCSTRIGRSSTGQA